MINAIRLQKIGMLVGCDHMSQPTSIPKNLIGNNIVKCLSKALREMIEVLTFKEGYKEVNSQSNNRLFSLNPNKCDCPRG